MESVKFRFSLSELKIDIIQIERVLGYKDDDDKTLVKEMISEILDEALQISDIKAEYRIFNNILFNKETGTILINDVIFEVQNIVFGQLKRSGSLAIFLCTAGEEIGRRSKIAMQERDFLRGYIYDVIGSEIVEAAADQMQNSLREEITERGMKITNRYSPGYCGWYVAEQHKLFSLMPDNFCGIRLTESALMDPVKSVSGFIGIGDSVRFNNYTCNMCDMGDCIYRRTKERKRI